MGDHEGKSRGGREKKAKPNFGEDRDIANQVEEEDISMSGKRIKRPLRGMMLLDR